MIFTPVLVLIATTLLSSTNAASSSVRNMQETSLGAAFLAIAKNYTPTVIIPTISRNAYGYFTAELEVSEIGPLAALIDPLCDQFEGYVESKSQDGNETVTTSYSVGCRFPSDKFDMFADAVLALLEDFTYTYSISSYEQSYSYSDPAMYVAQQKALENLMVSADTIEDLMLVVAPWQIVIDQQNYLSTSYNGESSLSITLSQKNIYPGLTDDLIF